MELIRPWMTTIGKFNVSTQCDLDEIAGALLAGSHKVNGSFPQMDSNDPALQPLVRLRDDVITPAVMEYIQTQFEMTLERDELSILTQCVVIPPGGDIETHIHAMSSLTVIMYPVESVARLIVLDPRTTACRGYPKQLVTSHFGNLRIEPAPGDVYILPSYLQHSVNAVGNELRLSFVNDYFISQD